MGIVVGLLIFAHRDVVLDLLIDEHFHCPGHFMHVTGLLVAGMAHLNGIAGCVMARQRDSHRPVPMTIPVSKVQRGEYRVGEELSKSKEESNPNEISLHTQEAGDNGENCDASKKAVVYSKNNNSIYHLSCRHIPLLEVAEVIIPRQRYYNICSR